MHDLKFTSYRALAAMLGAVVLAGMAAAQPQEGNGGQRRPPPPEAFEACKGLTAAKDCKFVTPEGPVTGTCFAPEGKPLACRPDRPGPPPGAPASAASRPAKR